MKPELMALFTGLCWALGSFFGKKGLHLASLDPHVGLIIRLVVSSIVVTLIALPKLGQLGHALTLDGGKKGLLNLFIFEGLLAGSLGMIFFYNAIKQGQLTKIMPLAFATPVWGFILGWLVGGEQLNVVTTVGAGFAIVGILILAGS